MAETEEQQALVCDNGSGMVKAGFAGDDGMALAVFWSSRLYLLSLCCLQRSPPVDTALQSGWCSNLMVVSV